MSETRKSIVFDAVRSAQEQNIVLDFAQSGYHHISKPSLGAQVDVAMKDGRTAWTTQGLTLLDEGLDQGNRNAINHLIGQLLLTSANILHSSHDIICYLLKEKVIRKGKHDGILVLLWAPESEVVFFPASHHIEHGTQGLQNRWGYIPSTKKLELYEQEVKPIPDGALSMLDFSLCFQIIKGSALAFVFVRQGIESKWQKVSLPVELEPKLNAMEEKGYRFNVTLHKDQRPGP